MKTELGSFFTEYLQVGMCFLSFKSDFIMLLRKIISPTLKADLEPLETIQRCPLTSLCSVIYGLMRFGFYIYR